jgi:hypothetical protein
MTTTITVDAPDLIELAEIIDYLVGSVDTLVTPATIAPSADGDAYDLNDVRTEITRLLDRLLPNPLPPGAHADDEPSELIAVCRGDIEDTAHILGQVEDFLLHGDDPAALIRFLGNNTTQQSLTRWIGELASYLRRLLANNPQRHASKTRP